MRVAKGLLGLCLALPLVVHGFGGGRPGPELAGLDGDVSCHYRNLPLLYAREAEPVLDLIEDLAADLDGRAFEIAQVAGG